MRKKERGRDNRHSRHIKTKQGDTARQAAQHRQRAEELDTLQDYTVGLFLKFTFQVSPVCLFFLHSYTIEVLISFIYFPLMIKCSYQGRNLDSLYSLSASNSLSTLKMYIKSSMHQILSYNADNELFKCPIVIKKEFIIFYSPAMQCQTIYIYI